MADVKTPEERLDRLERLIERLVEDREDRPRRRGRRDNRDRTVMGFEARIPRRRELQDALETLSMGVLRFRDDDDRDDWD